MGATDFSSRTYASTWAVVVYLIVLPFIGVIFVTIYHRLVDLLCGSEDGRGVDTAPQQAQTRTMAIAPILTKLPPNFRFTNYVNEADSDSSDWPSSAVSLNTAIRIPRLLLPCPQCTRIKSTDNCIVDLTIPAHERLGSITRQTAKMADVAEWLASQPHTQPQAQPPDSHEESALARGGALLPENKAKSFTKHFAGGSQGTDTVKARTRIEESQVLSSWYGSRGRKTTSTV